MTIYYTGIGSKKSGKHTEKEFMNIMDADDYNKKECLYYKKSLQCEPCKKSKKINDEYIKKLTKAIKQKKTYKQSKKEEKELKQQMAKCKKCVATRKVKKCNVDDYILFSGAKKSS